MLRSMLRDTGSRHKRREPDSIHDPPTRGQTPSTQRGSLERYFDPPLSAGERRAAALEGGDSACAESGACCCTHSPFGVALWNRIAFYTTKTITLC